MDPKKFLIFRETKLSCSNIKMFFLYFGKWRLRKRFLIVQETETLKKLLIFREMELFNPSSKKVILLQEMETTKNFLYSLKRNLFLYSRKRKPPPPKKVYVPGKKFIFQIKVYISGNGFFLYLSKWKP